MTLFLVTKESSDYGSQFVGIFSTFDKAQAQLNIKCNSHRLDNTLNKLIDGIWTTSVNANVYFRIEKVVLDKKEER